MGTGSPSYGEVELDGMRFKLAGPIQVSAVDKFPAKITIGDYSVDSNDLLSSWDIADLTGGHGVADHIEGTTDNRYRFGNVNTRYPKQVVLPWKRYGETVGAGYVYPLGDMTLSGTVTRFAVAGTHRLYADVPTGTPLVTTHWSDLGAITGVPTDRGIAYTGAGAQTMFYVPQGANGYSTYDPSGPTITNVTGGELMVSFCLWDDKLIGIDTDGQVFYAITSADTTTFTDYGAGGKLDDAFVPKHLVVYKNQNGDPTVYVVTDQNVWAFDPDSPRLYPIPELGSPNPGFGNAACVWRGNLYLASGMDIYEFNGSVRRNIGLSRDDGPSRPDGNGGQHSIPYQYLNQIVDLVPGQNSLYAYVKGTLVSGSTYYSSIHEYSSYGWCTNWLSPNSYLGPSRMAISRAGGGYFLWWGDLGVNNSKANTGFQPLPINDTNPKEALSSGNYAFGVGGSGISDDDLYWFETGWFDAGMPNYTKIASAITFKFDPTVDTASTIWYYRIDDGAYSAANFLLTVDLTGKQTSLFGTVDAYGVAGGLAFKKIELKVVSSQAVANSSPILQWISLAFRKIQNPSLAWTLALDLSDGFEGNSPDAMRTKLTTLRTQGTFVALKHLGTTYRVAVAGMSAAENSGQDHRGHVQLSVLEIPQEGGIGLVHIA